MQYNLYFRKEVWERFKDEKLKSNLVNQLLEQHYTGKKPQIDILDPLQRGIDPKEVELQFRPLSQVVKDEEIFGSYNPDNLVISKADQAVYDTVAQERVEATPEMVKELKKRGQLK